MDFENIEFVVDDGVARIILNRPKEHNPLSLKTAKELADALKLCERDDIKVIIICGRGSSFCAGLNVKETLENLEQIRDRKNFQDLGDVFNFGIIKKMRDLPKPIIVLTKGFTFGAGLSIVLAADYAIASEDTIFFSGFIRLGLSPDIGTSYFMPRHVGIKRAFELMCLGETFSARKAYECGIVNEVVKPDELESRGDVIAKKFLKAPKDAVARIKQLLNIAFDNPLEEHLRIEMEHTYQTMLSDDFEEGLRAVIERREPRFR
ncbi:Enoyl-CoA hydratase/carnithine racemase [Archaeoglobus sulfaticallidus PM70-1]|uniref:Enoyl-CoA hydratase/carnithine racemase n=1 Tax=Archaeoglobus sulfaticallidus PM70-1 TaxID=387631 RepID=N0B910_9EURY|nr:enoyl-CoA hydratase/isomerase family protein [Archaeoglobus sulfaticallidus]AGK60114.1 Enoyl-CoA hydratase/carnithine racemase [Archaeoglobus sulfaticallidus PM70-1]